MTTLEDLSSKCPFYWNQKNQRKEVARVQNFFFNHAAFAGQTPSYNTI